MNWQLDNEARPPPIESLSGRQGQNGYQLRSRNVSIGTSLRQEVVDSTYTLGELFSQDFWNANMSSR
jgi:hypothetical protein